MIKVLMIFTACFFLSHTGHAQKNSVQDTTTVLPNDIYSNTKGNGNNSIAEFIKKPGDSTKLERSSYAELIAKANRCYARKEFSFAAYWYTSAFAHNHGLGTIDDRFKAACSYAMINNNDSAFIQLRRITAKGHYTNLNELTNEKYLNPLHSDKRWQEIIDLITKNSIELIDKMNKEISDKNLPKETDQ